MTRIRHSALLVVSVAIGLASASANAASLAPVDRGTWGANGVPSYVNMYIYVPDAVAPRPPIVVVSHSCSTPIDGHLNSTGLQPAADRLGFILVVPEASGRNCWDVGTTPSLMHDGGGDTHAIAQMVRYTLTTYDGDPDRVYAMGGSSGAMMTQALMAVYPDLFTAGSAHSGVPAGCWAANFDPSNQWSGPCADGTNVKTPQEWGDLVRGMYPGYTGPRPRIQLFHGLSDDIIAPVNFTEAVEQWTNVLGLSEAADSMDTITTANTTFERRFWRDECGSTVFEAWGAPGQTHAMRFETDAILAFFGLDQPRDEDPRPPCPPEDEGDTQDTDDGAEDTGSGGTTGTTGGTTMDTTGTSGEAADTTSGTTGDTSTSSTGAPGTSTTDTGDPEDNHGNEAEASSGGRDAGSSEDTGDGRGEDAPSSSASGCACSFDATPLRGAGGCLWFGVAWLALRRLRTRRRRSAA